MLPFTLPVNARVLCLGAHCDDIDIGCGATLLRLREACPGIDIRWVILSSTPERASEARASAERFLGSAQDDRVTIESFRDGFLPYCGGEVKDVFERLKSETAPDLIFTHYGKDAHQDHRLVSELTWNTFRDHLILEYEIPKWDGDFGQPNLFVPVTDRHMDEKVRFLTESYPSQIGRHWFDVDTLRGLARLRGMEARAPDRLAEAYYVRKLRISLRPPDKEQSV